MMSQDSNSCDYPFKMCGIIIVNVLMNVQCSQNVLLGSDDGVTLPWSPRNRSMTSLHSSCADNVISSSYSLLFIRENSGALVAN